MSKPLSKLHQSILTGNINEAIVRARKALLSYQHQDGYWCFELEADCTIPAEYILMMHYMDEIDEEIEAKLAVYLRTHQGSHGGWPLFYGGDIDLSCSVKVYYALKLAGDNPDEPHMQKARKAIMAGGGAAGCNVFTRITLALFGQVPWRAVPFTPVELILLPRWSPFHFSKVSYWTRAVTIPLTILCSLKPKAKNPKRVDVQELFLTPPDQEKHYFPVRSRLNKVFLVIDKMGRFLEPHIPDKIRNRAVEKAEQWFIERLNGTDGLGGVFPAMVNAHKAVACLGYPTEHPYRVATKQALKNLLVIGNESAYCQPCVSPVWDTALVCLALHEEGSSVARKHAMCALDWLRDRQLSHEPADWRVSHPDPKGGGWPFQFSNPYYPDLDDTSVVAWAMSLVDSEHYREAIRQAVDWTVCMQSKNGGFGAYDLNNTHYYLNEIPFADHGALLDPPTSDVSARCASLLALMGNQDGELKACLNYLRKEQEPSGSWFGRWGTNYIYGTWSVLEALRKAEQSPKQPYIQRAVKWLKSVQRSDGGWGEDCDTYFHRDRAGQGYTSTAFQTAWALLGLMAVGEIESPEVQRGIEYLVHTQQSDGLWEDELFTAPGFPRVFFLKYHGYSKYFPLWALARYRNLQGI